MKLAKKLREIQTLQGHTNRVWRFAWNPTTGVVGIPLSFASCSGDKTLHIWEQNPSTSSWDCEFWMKCTPKLSNYALGPHIGSYWPLQALMPPLQFGKILEAITNMLPV